MMLSFDRATLGRTGLQVGRLGISASYGVTAAGVERAFEQGMNYLYWGSMRTTQFGQALRNLAPQRDRIALVLQSYSRMASLVRWSVERALRKLSFDHADVLLLGMWNKPVPARILDAAREVQRRGLVRFLAVSTHKRALVPVETNFDVVHFRYNAAHPGAEKDIFPKLPAGNRPGMVSFTATSWGELLKSPSLPTNERKPTACDCYRFVLSQPDVDLCLTGPSSMAHVEESLEALRRGPMSPDERDWMLRAGRAIYHKSLRSRFFA